MNRIRRSLRRSAPKMTADPLFSYRGVGTILQSSARSWEAKNEARVHAHDSGFGPGVAGVYGTGIRGIDG
jgi:hypothetical protein